MSPTIVTAWVAWTALAAATADPARPPRQTVEVQEIERRFTAPVRPAAAGGAAKSQPPVKLEDFLQTRADRLREITAAQIAKMNRLIAVTPEDDPQKPDFYFRLGELDGENQRFFNHQARALDQKIFDAAPGAKAALVARQQGFDKQERAWLFDAVKAYIAATRYRQYGRMDEVLFRLAHLLATAKRDDDARQFLLRLLKDHPTSKYVPDAYLSFAELYFDRGDMDSALRFYAKVEEFPASGVYAYAVYKKGWCQANLGDLKGALETFVGVIRMTDETRRGGKGGVAPPQAAVLAKEARKDVVTAYARVGGPDKAWELFRRLVGDGDSAGKMMEALAERYWGQGQAGDSTRIYKKIVANDVNSPRLCQWQAKILRNTLSAGNKRDQTQELERLGVVYAERAPQDAHLLDECRDGFHDASRELALVWHREAQRTKNADTYRLAERAYRLFLTSFPADKDAYEMSFYLGELLWALERWQEAAEQYTRVAEMNPHGKYLKDAAYAAVLGWKAVLNVEDHERGDRVAGRPLRRLAPQPLSEAETKMIAAFHRYRDQVPDAPELPVMMYREGYIYYDHNHFADACRLFRETFEHYPGHELAIYAANLFLDGLAAQKKPKEVVAWARKFLDTPAWLADREFTHQLIGIIAGGYEMEAREHEKGGDFKECGRSFLAAAEAQADSAQHAERLWNAAQCFQNAHLVGQAVKAWKSLLHDHPNDQLAQPALYRVGAGYHQLALYTDAAEHYEQYAEKFPADAPAEIALGNATVFREGLGDGPRALADMETFIRHYGKARPADAAAVFFQMSQVYEKQGRHDDLRDHLRSYLERWARHGGVDREVQARFRLGELSWRGSCPHAQIGDGNGNGACLRVERVRATRGVLIKAAQRKAAPRAATKDKPTQCGPPTKSKIVVLDRNRKDVAAAEEQFRQAIKLWKAGDAGNPIAGRDVEARKTAAAYAVAGAAFYLAESTYEDLLRLEFPRDLDFSKPSSHDGAQRRAAIARKLDQSRKRFAAYMAEKTRLLEQARAQYREAFQMRQAHWTIAAAARIGELYQNVAGQLYTAEIPKDLVEVDAWGNRPRELYCEELEDQATKIEAHATEGFASCLAAATRESWYNEWSQLCERELNQLQPVQYPLAAEIKPEAGYVPTTISAAPVAATVD